MGMGRGSKKVPLLRAWAARCAATYSVELVLGQSTGSVVGGAHGCLYPCQRRSSVAGATTLVQRFRRYCDPRHRPQPIQTFVMAITNQASRFMSTYGTTYILTTAGVIRDRHHRQAHVSIAISARTNCRMCSMGLEPTSARRSLAQRTMPLETIVVHARPRLT